MNQQAIDILESNAEIMHNIWSKWYKYQRDNSNPENIARWEIQSNTPYSKLSEEDKEKDRKQARKLQALGDGWIPVTERKPEKIKGNKILCSKGDEIFMARYYNYLDCFINIESPTDDIAEYDFWQPIPLHPTK